MIIIYRYLWLVCLSLRVWAVASDPNDLARGRATLASSYLYLSPPAAAVNGDPSTCFESDEELQPWWMLDIGHAVSMGTVTLSPSSPLTNDSSFTILVSNIRGDWRAGEPCSPSASPGVFSCLQVAGAVPKRFLYVVSATSAFEGVLTTMRICELRVSKIGPSLPLPYLTSSSSSLSLTLEGDSFSPARDSIILVPASIECGEARLAGIGVFGYRKYRASAGGDRSETFLGLSMSRRGMYKVCWCSGNLSQCDKPQDFDNLGAMVFNQAPLDYLGVSLPVTTTAVAVSGTDGNETLFFSDGDGLKRLSLHDATLVPTLVSVRFARVRGLAVNAAGTQVYATLGHAVFRVSVATGAAEILSGVEHTSGFAGDFSRDVAHVRLNNPTCLALDETRKYLFVCDHGNDLRIRVVALDGSEPFGYVQGTVEPGGVGTVLGGGLNAESGCRGEDFDLVEAFGGIGDIHISIEYGLNGLESLAVGLYVVGQSADRAVRLGFIHPNQPVGLVRILPATDVSAAAPRSIIAQESVVYSLRASGSLSARLAREYAPLGCYRERLGAFLLTAVDPQIGGVYECAEKVASTAISRVFGLRDGGLCVSNMDAFLRYAEEGKSSTCIDGGGSGIDNSVYIFTDTGAWSQIDDLPEDRLFEYALEVKGAHIVGGTGSFPDIFIIDTVGKIYRLPYSVGSDLSTLEDTESQPAVTDCVLCSETLEVTSVRYSEGCSRMTFTFNENVSPGIVKDLPFNEVHADPGYFGHYSKQRIYDNVMSIELGLYPQVPTDKVVLRIPSKREMLRDINERDQCHGDQYPIIVSSAPVFGLCSKWRAALEDGVRISGRAPKAVNWKCLDSWPDETLCRSAIQPRLAAKAWCGPLFAVDANHAQLCETIAELDTDFISDESDVRVSFRVEVVDWRGEVYSSESFSTRFVADGNVPLARAVGSTKQSLRVGTTQSARFEVASRSLFEECRTSDFTLVDVINDHVEIEWRVGRKPVSVGGEVVTSDWRKMEPLQSLHISPNVGLFDFSKLPENLRSPGDVLSVVALISYTSGKTTGVPVPFEISIVEGERYIPIYFTASVSHTCPAVFDASELVTGRPDLVGLQFAWSCIMKSSGVSIPACLVASGPYLVLAPGTFPPGIMQVTLVRGDFRRTMEISRVTAASLETLLIPDLRGYDVDITVKLLSRGTAAIASQCTWTREEELVAKYVVAGDLGFERLTIPERASEEVVIPGAGLRLRNFRTIRSRTFSNELESFMLPGTTVDVHLGLSSSVVLSLKETASLSAGEVSVYPVIAETAETYVLIQQAWSGVHNSALGSGTFMYGAVDHGENELLLDFRLGRSQFVPLLGGEKIISGSVKDARQSFQSVVAASATVRSPEAKARDPSVQYDYLAEMDELLTRTLFKIQTVASLNEPRLECLVYREYAGRLPLISSLQLTQDARDISNKALMTVSELFLHLNDAYKRLESLNLLHVAIDICGNVRRSISGTGYDDLDLIDKVVRVFNTYFDTVGRIDRPLHSDLIAVGDMVDLISTWILPRFVFESDFLGAGLGKAGLLSKNLMRLVDQLGSAIADFTYSSERGYDLSVQSVHDPVSIVLGEVDWDIIFVAPLQITSSDSCDSVKRTVFRWIDDPVSYSRYNSSDALFGAFSYVITSACSIDLTKINMSYHIQVPDNVHGLSLRPAYSAFDTPFVCVKLEDLAWSASGCSGTYQPSTRRLYCECLHTGGHNIMAGRLLPYPYELELKPEIDYALVHNGLTYFLIILLGAIIGLAVVRTRDTKWLRRKTPGEFLVQAALHHHQTNRLKSRTRTSLRVIYDCVIRRDPRFFSAHVIELQLMRSGSREDPYKKFDSETSGRLQPDMLSLLWEAPLNAVSSMEAVYSQTLARKKEKLVGVTRQAQLMAGSSQEIFDNSTAALVPVTVTVAEEYDEENDDARSKLLELQRREARFQAAQTFKGIRTFATERRGEKPGTHTGQNWEESMMLVKAKFNGNPNFSGAFANAQLLAKDLNDRYPVVQSLLWTTWSIRDFVSHFFYTLHPLIGDPAALLAEVATVFTAVGICSILCFIGTGDYPKTLPEERTIGEVLSDTSRALGILEFFTALVAWLLAKQVISQCVVTRFLLPQFTDNEDFDVALRRWHRLRVRGLVYLVIFTIVSFFAAFSFAAICPQVNAGRAVAASLFALFVYWVLIPSAEILVYTYIFWKSKWSADFDGVLAVRLYLLDTSEAAARQRLIDEEFLTDVYKDRLHRRVNASYRRFTRITSGLIVDHGASHAGEEVLSDGEDAGESE